MTRDPSSRRPVQVLEPNEYLLGDCEHAVFGCGVVVMLQCGWWLRCIPKIMGRFTNLPIEVFALHFTSEKEGH